MLCSIDFEYNGTSERHLNLVCVAWSVDRKAPESMWLFEDDEAKEKFKNIMLELIAKDCKFICFNASAEAGSFFSLGIDPTTCNWIDLQCEYKMITNHYNKIKYGKHLINGREVITTPKNYFGKKKEGSNHSKPDMSLVSMTYKLLGIKEDLKYKNKIRDFIIRSDTFSSEKREEILNYCVKDIKDLYLLLDKVFDLYNSPRFPVRKMSGRKMIDEVLYRGECGARAAVIEREGIPVSVDRMTTLAKNVPHILKELAGEILELFPEIAPFKWNERENRYSVCEKNIKDFIINSPYGKKWAITETGAISLKLEAFTNNFSYRHDFPKDCLFAQMIRYKKTLQCFNGLKIKENELIDVAAKKKKNVFDSLGKDGRIKPYINIYGAQSARYQPKSVSFPFLWSAWIRSVVEAPKGKFICGIDYSSQEFLVSALLSEDKVMIEAYNSGDPYMFLGKAAGVIPKDGTRKEYAKERSQFKTVTLGISYGMGAFSLSRDLTNSTGEEYSEEKAQELIDMFFRIYKDYAIFTNQIQYGYLENGCIKLIDGWYMFGDNPNNRSVGNVPIQGMGSCILRKAVQLCQQAGIKVIFPLHDALYCEVSTMEEVDLFYDKMQEAFIYFFDDKESASLIRQDIDLWGIGLKEGKKTSDKGRALNCKSTYIDERTIDEYNKFKKYFKETI